MRRTDWRARVPRRCLVVILLAAPLVSILAVSRAAGNTISVTEADNGRTVTLASGDTLMVSLGSTPGTGFGWRVAKVDRKVLKETGKPELIHSPNPMPGAPATQRFRFVVSGEGTTRLELEYVRPWERGVPPARTFHLGVTVR